MERPTSAVVLANSDTNQSLSAEESAAEDYGEECLPSFHGLGKGYRFFKDSHVQTIQYHSLPDSFALLVWPVVAIMLQHFCMHWSNLCGLVYERRVNYHVQVVSSSGTVLGAEVFCLAELWSSSSKRRVWEERCDLYTTHVH